VEEAVQIAERNSKLLTNTIWFCEPQLGNRGLYGDVRRDPEIDMMAVYWVLNLADGTNSLLEIAERSKVPFAQISSAAEILLRRGMLK